MAYRYGLSTSTVKGDLTSGKHCSTCQLLEPRGRLLEAWLAANHWLGSIESYSFLWQLTLVSMNDAFSNSFGDLGLVVKKIVVVEVVKMIQVNYGKGVFFSVVGLVKVRKISDLKRCAILDSMKKTVIRVFFAGVETVTFKLLVRML